MADFNQTISNTLRAQGPSRTSKWGSMIWGTDNWGDTRDTTWLFRKYVPNTFTLSDSVRKTTRKYVSNTLSLSSDANIVSLRDASGYYYVFADNVTDPDNRYFPTWSEPTDPTDSFTAVSAVSTTWSDA